MSEVNQQMREAYECLKAGKKQEAAHILAPILRADQDSADAWWLMAHSLTDPNRRRTALEHVLRLRPDHAKARQMLDALDARAASPPPTPPPAPNVGSLPERRLRRLSGPATSADNVDEPPDDFFLARSATQSAASTRDAAPAAAAPPRAAARPKSGGGAHLTLAGVVVLGVAAVIVMAVVVVMGFRGQMDTGGAPCPESIRVPLDAIEANVFFGLTFKGCIALNEPIRNTVGTFDDDGWAFWGDAGAAVTVAVTARSRSLDTELALYDPRGNLVAENDDIDFLNNTDSRLQVTLPTTGTYTIVVSAWGDGGPYELVMR